MNEGLRNVIGFLIFVAICVAILLFIVVDIPNKAIIGIILVIILMGIGIYNGSEEKRPMPKRPSDRIKKK